MIVQAKVRSFLVNKKVLLHERKRLTAHHVASTRYAALVGGTPIPGWGVPHSQVGVPPSQTGGTPSQVGGTPHLDLGRGYPWTWEGGTPPAWTLEGGTPLPRPGKGYPPVSQMGYPLAPPPPRRRGVDWHTKCEYYLPLSYGCGR